MQDSDSAQNLDEMPFPTEPLTYRGGCNCTAVRYRVTLPALADRADSPYDPDNPNPVDPKLPMSLICHCNDCRRSTGQLINFGLANELLTVEFLLSPRSSKAVPAVESGERAQTVEARDAADEAKGVSWISAGEFFDRLGGPKVDLTADSEEEGKFSGLDTYLRTYRSSHNKTRAFCGRCGTPLFYFLTWSVGYPDPWPTQLDIWAGSVDRVDLEREWFVPVREVWLDFGIGWVENFVGAEGLRKCRTWK